MQLCLVSCVTLMFDLGSEVTAKRQYNKELEVATSFTKFTISVEAGGSPS